MDLAHLFILMEAEFHLHLPLSRLHLLHHLVALLELDEKVVLVEIDACHRWIHGLLLRVDLLLLGIGEPILLVRLAVRQAGDRLGGPLERILLLLTNPMLGFRCATVGGVLVRSRLRTGITMVLLPLLPDLKFKLVAEVPREE